MVIQTANRLNKVEEYYFAKKLEEIRQLNLQGKNIINFGIGSPDLFPSQETIVALKESSEKPTSHGYQAYKGIPEFRNAVADFYKNTYQVNVNPDTEVLPLMGSKEGILHLTMAFVNEGDAVLIPNPGYPTYTSNSNLAGAKTLYYDLTFENNWQPDFNQLENYVKEHSNIKIMWVNYPHMPTGAQADIPTLEILISFAKQNQILLAFDNPYSLVLNTKAPFSIFQIESAKEVAVELNSLSKSFNMAGWRVGMMIGDKEYLNAALKVKSNIDSGMFLPVQQAAIQALKNSSSWHEERNAIYKKRREIVFQIFDLLNFEYDKNQVGMFVWAKAPNTITEVSKVSDAILYQANVFITPGFIFGSNGNRFLRASLCVPIEKMVEGLERIKNTKLDWA